MPQTNGVPTGAVIQSADGKFLSRTRRWVHHRGPHEAWVFNEQELAVLRVQAGRANATFAYVWPAFYSARAEYTIVTGPPRSC